jgi:hypothetical protein
MVDIRDPRFGGNMERANTGIPYPTGGRDVRFEGSLPHQFQYRDQGRTVVSDTEPAFTDMGRNRNVPFPADGSALPHELQHHGVPRQHPNPRMRGMGRGMGGRPPGPPSNIGYDRMGGGLGGLQQTTGLWQDWKRIFNRTGNEDLANQWVESQQVAYNVGDTYPLEGKGGYGTRGPFTIAPHDIQELETIPLDMQFDQWGNPIGGDDYGYFDDTFAARGGLMSLRR